MCGMLRGKKCSNPRSNLHRDSRLRCHACLSECRSVASNHESLGPAACMCPAAVPVPVLFVLCVCSREVGDEVGECLRMVGGRCAVIG